MATSGTFNFGSAQNEEIITEAYERVGILPDVLTPQKVQTALRSLNLILQSWPNKGLNLWTVQQGMIGLNPNQSAYILPNNGIDILEATVRTSTRNLGGTAASSAGGVATNAFDNNTNTACTQTAPNGNISYNWGAASYAISMVGIQSKVDITYTLSGEYSLDGATWITAITIPAQAYTQSEIAWFVAPVPTPAPRFRIRETGGAILNIEELYFNTNINDSTITACSRSEYIAYPNKNQPGRPSNYWVNRQIVPVVYLYPTPNSLYNNMYFTYTQPPEDAGTMINTADVPARFIEALAAALAARLAVKEQKGDLVSMLKPMADEEYSLAASEDRERVPLRIYGDYSSGWAQS